MSERQICAAIIIQAHCRGYLARKVYFEKLLVLFEENETKRREKERSQVLEGELLIEKHLLHHNIADNETLNQNEERRMNMMAIRIQQAWKKHKGSSSREFVQPELQAINTITGAREDNEGGTTVQHCEPRAHDSRSHDSANTGINNAKTGSVVCNEQNLPGSESGDNQPTTSTIKVEQLASQVKSLLLQDDSDETVLFEGETLSSFANSPKHKVSSVNSSGNQVAQTVNNHTEASPTQQTSKVELNAGVSQSDVHQESDVVQSSLITPTTHVNVTSTYTVHDSKTRMISDNIPTLTKLLESDGKLPEPNREVVTSPEERYRLCYTIDLSDSSSEEDKNNSTLQESDFPGVPGTTTGDLEANTFWNHHPIHEFEDFLSDDESALQHIKFSPQHMEGVCEEYQATCKQLDHSTSPLYTMSTEQLRQLFMSLEQQLLEHSNILIQLLEERDTLANENRLLKTNISRLARNAQSLYVTP